MPLNITVLCETLISRGTPYPLYEEEQTVNVKIGADKFQMPKTMLAKFKREGTSQTQIKAELCEWNTKIIHQRTNANMLARNWAKENGIWMNDVLVQGAIPYITPLKLPEELATIPIPSDQHRWTQNFSKHARIANEKRSNELKSMARDGHCLIRPIGCIANL